jgi:hypothetical protein
LGRGNSSVIASIAQAQNFGKPGARNSSNSAASPSERHTQSPVAMPALL